MRCPDEIADVLLQILHAGILRMRNAPETAYLEADHLHNLPQLIASYHPELLDYYLDVERPSYLASGTALTSYSALWEKLLLIRASTRS